MESDRSEAVTKVDQFFIAMEPKAKGSPLEPQGQFREGWIGERVLWSHGDPQLSLQW